MTDFKNHEHVAALGSSIDEQFEKFRAAHVACVAASADETETSVIVEGYNSQAANYNEFKQRVADRPKYELPTVRSTTPSQRLGKGPYSRN